MGFLDAVFGAKPDVADLEKFNLTDEQLKAIMGNIGNFDQISKLGNLFQDYVLNQYEHAIPGFKDILAKGGSTVETMMGKAGEMLQGLIPKDVEDYVKRSSAYQSLTSGTAGSGMGGANLVRNLGLTSLGMIDKGANLVGLAGNALQRWAGLSGAQSMAGMLLTPKEQADFDLQQAVLQRNVQQQKNNVAAAPNPGLQQLNQWIEQVGGTVVGSYLGAKPGGNYKTSYDPNSMGAGADPMSDVSNPGHYVDTGGGGGGGAMDVAQGDQIGGIPVTRGASDAYSAGTGYPSEFGYGPPNNNVTLGNINLGDIYRYQSNFQPTTNEFNNPTNTGNAYDFFNNTPRVDMFNQTSPPLWGPGSL